MSLDIALYYARQGWPVFPLTPGGKVPLISTREGGHGYKDATRNATQVETWWTTFPDANVGIATGRLAGVVVIDVDVKEGARGLESIRELEPPQTFTVRTPSRGFHLYYQYPASATIGCGTALVPGIDWRGDGGYVVAAGSVTPLGTYEIVRRLPIVELPVSLVQRITATRGRRVVQLDEHGVMVIPERERNKTMTSIAGALRRYGVGPRALLESLRAVNTEHCSAALPEDELVRIANSVARYAPGERRTV